MGLLSLCAAGSAANPTVAGDWLGKLSLNGIELRLGLHLKQNGAGEWIGSFDSLDQNAKGIPLAAVTFSGGKLKWNAPSIAGSYEGTYNASGDEISGSFFQREASMPLRFARATEPVTLNRPQEPKPPFPYVTEDVSYDNPQAPGVRLAGTLTKPKGAGPFPAVLLITGSGPQDRDEAIFGHKPFLLIADTLTRRGIAVLRVDDRGIGKSTGNFGAATTADFATDVEAGLNFLLARKDIARKHVGLLGHSEGGLIAPIVARKMPEVSFIVLLAGPGVPGDQILAEQTYRLNLLAGIPEETAVKDREFERQLLAIVKGENDPAKREQQIGALTADLPDDVKRSIKNQMAALGSPWFRYFLALDPAPELAGVKCPVLALIGSKDSQVPAEQNMPALQAALRKGGNPDVTTAVLPGLNHLFQECTTGAPAEYGKIEQTMSPKALDVIADWIQKHTS
jgi:pimeloyl-ACP methyl ester carboxylesterase